MDEQKWVEHYTNCDYNKVWIKVMTEEGKHWFFSDYNIWYEVKAHCEKNDIFIQDFHLQFRSHQCIIDVADSEGIYFVRSVMGAMGQKTKNFFTVGILRNDIVYKKMWLVPELIVEKEIEDTLENCFKEAMLYNGKKKKNGKEQV